MRAWISVLSPGAKRRSREVIKNPFSRYALRRYPSAGSTFKRPEGYFAGALIESCGLKGASVGGAQVSEKHAGFVINHGGATSADILALIRLIQNTVYAKKGVRLEPEVRFLGFSAV